MSDRAPIPNLPPISSIKDPDVRVALESMWNAWRVRNGDVGDGTHKFLTAADLTDALTTTTVIRGGGGTLGSGTSTTGVAPPNTSWIKPLLVKIDDYIQQSWLWKQLGERIEWIDTPEWFIDKFDRSFGTAIKNEEIIRQAADSSLASSITTVSAVLNDNIAVVREELTANVTLTEATASKVTTLQTEFNDNKAQVQNAINTLTSADQSLTNQINQAISDFNGQIAGVKTQIQTVSNSVSSLAQTTSTQFTNVNNNVSLLQTQYRNVSDQAGATASAVTQLQNTVANVNVAAQNALSLATTIDGQIKGAWTVKFDANGYVTGAGLSLEGKNGNYQSSFYVRADKFAIGNPQYPGVTPKIPFKVLSTTTILPDGTSVPPGVYMDEAVVYKLTGTYIDAGTLNAAEIYTGSTWLDRVSGYPILSQASGYFQLPGEGHYALEPRWSGDVRFYSPAHHPWVPLRKRLRGGQYGGPVTFIITASASVDHFFSIWYRINDGSWGFIAKVIEYQNDFGTAAVAGSVTLYVPSGPWYVDFGMAVIDENGNWTSYDGKNQYIRDGSLSVSAVNV